MEFEFAPSNQLETRSVRHRRPWLEMVLLLGFLFCLLIGLSALGILLWFRSDAEISVASAPRELLRPERITPAIALMTLAGDPPQALAVQTVTAGELDTGYATLLFDANFAPTHRVSLLLQLAQRYRNEGTHAQAVSVYKLVRALAVLAPDLSPIERTQALMQSAAGLLAAEETAAALESAVQAARVAAQTPDLLPAQRSQLFETLRPLARDIGDARFSQQISELARNPYLTPMGQLLTPRLFESVQPAVLPQEVAEAQNVRRAAARALADRIRFFYASGVSGDLASDIEPERLALEEALLAEDRVRRNFIENRLTTSGLSLEQELQLLLDYRQWVAHKSQVALNGFGLSLVPLWTTDQVRIDQELTVATDNVAQLLDAIVSAAPTETDRALLRIEKLHWLALQWEWGLYPQGNPLQIGEQLRFEQTRLREPNQLDQPSVLLALPAVYEPGATLPGFHIQVVNER